MSETVIENAPLVAAKTVKPSPVASAGQTVDFGMLSPWKWCAITCLLLAISGGIRIGRDLQFQNIYQESAACPIALSDIPKVLGTWHEVEGSEKRLDPRIAQVAGATAQVIRQYTDDKTGETVEVMVIYGPAITVFGHTPVACYPAAGYQPVRAMDQSGSVESEMQVPGLSSPVQYTKAYFTRNVAGASEYVEAMWTFRHDGVWQPEMTGRWKRFRAHPGMFRVQIHRPAMAIVTESPCEPLLRDLVHEIEARIAASAAAKANAASSAAAPKP